MISNIGIIVCSCPQLSKSVDFNKLNNEFKDHDGVSVVVLHREICKNPSIIKDIIRSERLDALIIAGCNLYRDIFKDEAASGGLNPLLVELIPTMELFTSKNSTESMKSTLKLELMIKGIIEKMKRMELAKNVAPRKIKPEMKFSRRMFLRTIPRSYQIYEPTPLIERDKCVGTRACDFCINVCPVGALRSGEDGRLIIDVDKCNICGVCSATCPTGAIQIPTATDEQLDAEMRTILTYDRAEIPLRLLMFIDSDDYSLLSRLLMERNLGLPEEIFPIELPSLALLSEVTILSAIYYGAAGIILIHSRNNARKIEYMKTLNQKITIAKEILAAIIPNAAQISFIEFDDAHPEQLMKDLSQLVNAATIHRYDGEININLGRANRRTALIQVLRNLSKNNNLVKDVIDYGGLCPFADVSIDKQRCTICEMCVNNCPVDAFSLIKNGDAVSIGFLYQRCVGCKLCESLCPEKAIILNRIFSISKLINDTATILITQRMIKCSRCGKQFITEGKLKKLLGIYGSLGAVDADKLQALKLCPECRRSRVAPVEYDKWFIYR